MTSRKLTTLAGAAALAAAVSAGAFALAQSTQPSPNTPRPQPVSPTTPSKPSNPVQPQPTHPNNPSNPSNPNNPNTNPNNPNSPANPNDPNNPPAAEQPIPPTIEPPITRQPTQAQRLFMLESNQEAKFNEFASRLTRMEQQLTTSNDQLLRELGDARQAGDTNARLDKLASVLQKSLQHDRQLMAELTEIRMALTGNPNATNPTAPAPGAPGSNPPTTTPRTPSNPTTPSNPSNPPRPGPGG